jgi:hypothetical protein
MDEKVAFGMIGFMLGMIVMNYIMNKILEDRYR